MSDSEKKRRVRVVDARERPDPNPASLGRQMYEAATLVAAADHYLVHMRAPEGFEYDDVVEAAQLIFDEENEGALAPDEVDRSLIALSEATGYSLTDLGA